MASQVIFTLKSCFSFVDDRFLSEFLCRTMFKYGSSLWVSICNLMLNLFWLISKFTKRWRTDNKPRENGSNFVSTHSQEDRHDSDFATEKVASSFSFRLLGHDPKDSDGNLVETEDSVFLKTGFSPGVLKYQSTAANDVTGFMEETETMSLSVQEMFVDSNDGMNIYSRNIDSRVSQNEESQELQRSSNGDVIFHPSGFESNDCIEESNLEEGTSDQERAESSVNALRVEEILEDKDASDSPENEETDDDIAFDMELPRRNEFSTAVLKPEPEISSDGMISLESKFPFSEEKACRALPSSNPMIVDKQNPEVVERIAARKESFDDKLHAIREASVDEHKEEKLDDEFIELKPRLSNANEVNEESLSLKDENSFEVAQNGGKESKLMDEDSGGFEEEKLVKGSFDSDSDDEDEFDILLEHQQLVKQMKMERNNSVLKGLPTISEEEEEECETPRFVENLKPLKIEEKLDYKDLMEEIQKFYKRYAEKMRKLDILNYQSLHAISFLQLKESQLFMPSKKTLLSSIKPFALPSLSLFKQQRVYADPTLRSINEIHRDLEMVYVGQVCLSWEILVWQYGKVKELVEHDDSHDSHSYNQVAGDYQQFQVFVQRFLEDERFQGPRIQHYVNCRCFCRGLLQVPGIKDDCSKDKKEIIGEEIDAISVTMLAESIKDSMQVFWDFVREDKDEGNGVPKSVQGCEDDLKSPADSQILINVRTCLEKKGKKIKDIQRRGKSIMKMFQEHSAGSSDALLMSQVELKLVARVLSLSRLTTDHLMWCQRKLDNISIVNRKVSVEPSFLLFPC